MKSGFLFFSIITIAIFTLGAAFTPVPVFAQSIQENEQEQIEELQALLSQLILLVAQLQQQLLAIVQAQALTTYTCGQAEIAWEKVSGASGYVLYRNGREVYSGRDLKFVDTGLAPGIQYAYTVAARNAGGLGPASLVKTITTSVQCPPPPPSLWTQEGICGGSIQASWNQAPEAHFYEVFRSKKRVFRGNTLFFLDQGLRAGRSYTYMVRAGNTGGLGEFSQEVKTKASAICPPEAPQALVVGTPFLNDSDAQEGIITFSPQERPSGVTVQSGERGKNILSFRVGAKLSPITIERVDVDIADRPWLFLSTIEIRDGSRVVASVDAEQNRFSKVGDSTYRLSFTGLAMKVAEGRSKTISVRVVAKDGLVLTEPRHMTVSIPANSVRTRDEINITHFGPGIGEAGNFVKPFFVKREEIRP